MNETPHFRVYRVWNNVTKKWYRSNHCSTFGNTGAIKNSLGKTNIENYTLVVLTKDEPFCVPLKSIYE